jgi:hypothetical protein
MSLNNLFDSDYFQKKLNRIAAQAKSEVFEDWSSARARYIEAKIEPLLDKYRESDQDWFSDWSRRRGVVRHSSDLIYSIQKLNPRIFVQQQICVSDDWGLYADVRGKVQYLSAVPKSWLTEFSFCLLDDRNLPTEERRGWRTVLVRLLYCGALTWDQVFSEFGDPEDGYNDYRWQSVVHEIRYGDDLTIQRNLGNVLE